ncbi:autophagy-related protein 2 homolog A-like [Myxocyprinus asiaticus]|uniref:autophagy-related protein 2 homolog A-like n=1 Tax=Myxocyprinus asiaticus TaxID=70543 RepID=UPI002222CD44|nr:autophagy-related protein 2 homolog A-like [Myxocyprinus asiaticus]
MSRWLFPWSGSIKKRACQYLLQHYLGHFLEERLSLDQLSLDLYNGSGVIRNINLDVWAVNELLDSLGAPLEIVEGFVSSIAVTIPWAALLTDHCTLEVTGLQITCRPKYRTNGSWDSQGWSSCMTSSMQLAQECLKDPPEASEEPPAPLEGLEMFAQTIETVLRRIKVTFLETIVRVEHHPLDSDAGVALEMRIKRVDYCDEAVRDSSQTVPVDIHQPPAFLHKILQLNSVQLLYETLRGSQGLIHSDMESSRESFKKTDEEDDDDEVATDAPQSLHPTQKPPEPLLIGQCSGFIETTVKIKQNEMLPGPKFELDGKVGCLHLLLSPNQITHLTDLLSALCIDTSEGSRGGGVSSGGISRPLDSDDLRLIEEDLSKQLNAEMIDRDLELDTEPYIITMDNGEMFYSMGPGYMTSSVLSTRSGSELSDSDMESSIHSQSSLAQTNPLSPQGVLNCPRPYPVPGSLSSLPHCSRPPRRSSRGGQSEPLKPDSLLRLSLGGVTLTLLEQELPPGPDGPSSLAEVSQLFFRELAFFKDSMFSERGFQNLRGSFTKACPHSHIRVTGAAVQLACEMRSAGRHTRVATSDLSFSRLELLECLWDSGGMQYTELLQFQSAGLITMGAAARPCAQFHHSLSEKHMRKSGTRRRVVRRDSSLQVELGELTSELDLDILGRLENILQALSYCPTTPQRTKAHTAETHSVELHCSLLLQAPHAVLKVRFPIPDLRPPGLRRPLSQRAVRSEVLSLQISNLELRSQQGPDVQQEAKLTKLLEACFTDLLGMYEGWEGESFPCIHVQKSPVPHNPDGTPRIQVRVKEGAGGVCDGVKRDLGLSSVSLENPCELREKNSSPFSSNRTMFETEEMVIPADPEEMNEFQSQCTSQCQYVVDITFPVAYILLPSKEAFQSIYNRINNDLLMWEPPPPPQSPPPAPPSSLQGARSLSHQHRHVEDEFYLCKSAVRLDSDSEEEEPQFNSANQSKRRKQSESQSSHALSLLCLTVLIGKGRLQAMTDSKNEAGCKVEHYHGELILDLEGGKIFSVAQHQNNPNLNFLTIESKRVELYHKAEVPDSPIPVRLEMPSFTPPGHLDPTIYPTEVGVSSISGRETDIQMLSAAIQITLDLERNVKEFLVALRLHGATLRHHMALTNHSWHEQIVDFLDVIDDDILGYTPPAVITVLHTHLATCAVDYRPLYLPLRLLFTAESFSLSSNIIVDTATFHLRFILDDSALYLSDKCESETVDLRRDYVCVLDIDLLKLAITTWKGTDSSKLTQPLFELRCSNNVVHVHTCADSCAALVNMLQYLVSQGDLHPPPHHTSPTEIAGQKLLLSESPASLPSCPPAETAEINQCDLTDALIDTERILQEEAQDSDSPSIRRASPVSVYLFPGEAPKLHPSVLEGEESDLDGLVSTAMEAHADMSEEGSEASSDNDDFCILEAPGMGIPPRDGEPVVTVLSQGLIKVWDGYYSRPRGSSDLLRAPSRFPVPQNRVVLREVSIVWHLYGGKDFGGKPSSAHTQHCQKVRSAAPGARGSPSRSAGPSRPQNSWRWVGGSGRQHTLLMEIQLTKVSFQHETYPVVAPPTVPGQDAEGMGLGEQPISRQVFIVQELEVRDRLASSQINKFLYLYTSESMPRRAHSNMLTIKALQVMPESGLGGPECCLRVSLLPLRLNIDQDALFFLKDFFSNMAAEVNPFLPADPTAEVRTDPPQKHLDESDPTSGLGHDLAASVETTYSEQSSSSAGSSSTSDQPIYFREFRFTSEVPIWLDYQGKHVVIEQGTFAGILIGLAQLNCSELKLKRLCCRHGLLGVDKVIQYAVNEWLTDIRKNQLPGILGGVGPMHSVVQLFHGVRDLFWMPIEQYRKDGRIIRGLQRGAASFGTSTASAALELSNRLVQAIQATAETVYDILSPTPPLTRYITEGRPTCRPRRTPQPADLREGVAKAYDTVREGVIDTAQTLCDVASRGHEQKGLPGAVGGVLRQIPPTVVRPLIVASEATSNLLGGMRNQIKPDARKEDFLKWRTDDGQE